MDAKPCVLHCLVCTLPVFIISNTLIQDMLFGEQRQFKKLNKKKMGRQETC